MFTYASHACSELYNFDTPTSYANEGGIKLQQMFIIRISKRDSCNIKSINTCTTLHKPLSIDLQMNFQ